MRVPALLLSAVLGSCAAEAPAPDEDGLEILFAPLSADNCTAPATNLGRFPDGIDQVFVRVSGYPGDFGFGARVQPENLDRGRVLVGGVPPGDNLLLELFACEGATTRWTGRVPGLSVKASAKVAPTLYMTRVDAMSCTGAGTSPDAALTTELESPRAFPSLVSLANGRVLVIGGFGKYTPKAAGPELAATSDSATVLEYFPNRGLFSPWSASLTTPRGMAHTALLADGQHVLVVGGLNQAVLGDDPPLAAASEGALAVEILDSEARTVATSGISLPALPLSAFASGTVDGETDLVLLGGRQASGFPSNRIWHARGASGLFVSGTATVVEDKTLGAARMGATATWLPEGGAIVVGGTPSADPNQLVEVLSPAFIPSGITLSGDTASYTPFGLHSAVLVSSSGSQHVLVVAGGSGLTQESEGALPEWIPPYKAATGRLYALTVDTAAGTGTLQNLDAGITSPARLRRVFADLRQLGDGRIAWSGGYDQLGKPGTLDASCKGDTESGCYLDDLTLLSVSGEPGALQLGTVVTGAALGEARFGHASVQLRDGTVLLAGGLRAVSASSDVVSRAAEVFNGPLAGGDPCAN